MDFLGRYQVLEMLKDGEARTFKVLQTSSGRTVLLHQLWVERTPPNQPDLASLVFGFLRRATADEMKVLVDMGEEAGRVFVVTEDLPIFHDLRQWLQAAAGAPGAAGKVSVSESGPSGDSGATEEFDGLPSATRQESVAASDTTLLPSTPKVLEPPVAPPRPSRGKDEPGEFTRVFLGEDMPMPKAAGPVSSSPKKASARPASKAERPPKSPPPAGSEAAFESRRRQSGGPMKPAVEKRPAPSPAAPGPIKKALGEFTRIFYGPDKSKATSPSPVPAAEARRLAPVAPGQPSQPKGPGEFTRLFRPPPVKEKPPATRSVEAEPSQPLPPPVQPAEQKGRGEFTRLFHASPEAARSAGPPAPSISPRPTVPLSSSSSPQGAGELTQLLQGYQPAKSAPTAPVLARPQPVAPPPPSKADEVKPGDFTMIFQRLSEPVTPAPPAAPSPPTVQTPRAAPQPPEADEYMRMFELPSGGAGASPQGPPPAATQPAVGRAMPAIPMTSVSSPGAPSMPYIQPPVVPQPQPYQIPPPQFQQAAVPPAFAMTPQPVMPQMQPMAVPAPAAPQAAPLKTGKSKFLVPLIILGGLFLIAVVTILFFALRH